MVKLTKVSAEAKSALHDGQIRVRIFIKHIALSCIFENGFTEKLGKKVPKIFFIGENYE